MLMATKYRLTNLINCDESNRHHHADDNKNVTSSSIELRTQLMSALLANATMNELAYENKI